MQPSTMDATRSPYRAWISSRIGWPPQSSTASCSKAATASESANQGFADFIEAVSEPESPDLTIEKLAGIVDVLKPHLIQVYEKTSRETDQICDAPTIELLEDIVRRTRRHVSWGKEVLDRLCDTDAKRQRRQRRSKQLQAQLDVCGGVTGALTVANA